ncbi:nucleoside-diphosphate kinase [Psychroflexus sp. CAK1W]|uniref:nucleoside-diphosphate kinase n=1 Tax=Psychroflexus curvus TaxID=2873595 RepID=UPI001CCF407F|nr:nucleoside-diphosphate kinase [Psychroflexus curvus]MBZ9628150.1 nucleoside-diphosphate kinase [Psychroflexus curvus]
MKNHPLISQHQPTEDILEESVTSHEIEFFSLGILKPDCIQRELVHEAFRRISNTGVEIVISKTITLTENDVLLVYSRCVEKSFFYSMQQFLISSECIVFIVKSNNNDAIRKLNSVVGFTEPVKAKPGTLRELGKNLTHNIAHSSDNSINFLKESGHFFSQEELIKAGLKSDYYIQTTN